MRFHRWMILAATLPLAVPAITPAAAFSQSAQPAQSPPLDERLAGGSPADTTTALALSGAFRAAAERALPAVVFIAVEQAAPRASAEQLEQVPAPFRDFFRGPQGDQPRQGTGSGFIIDEAGHIITNTHVVADATRLTVRLLDGREYTGRVVGTDVSTDIAVIRIEPRAGESFPAAPLGESDGMRVGDWVLALGSPLGLDFTVTAGIVSAKGRQISGNLESFIQTDAVINPGNSGGPLIDLFGRVVGVNSAIFGSNRFVGYGFAVPINLARRVAGDLMEYGYLRRPLLGAQIAAITAVDAEIYDLAEVRGALIAGVSPGGPAATAGLRPGDIVLTLNGMPIRDDTHLITSLAEFRPGQRITLEYRRDGRVRDVAVELGEFSRPPQQATAPAPANEAPEQVLGFTVRELRPADAERVGYGGEGGVVVQQVQPFGGAQERGVRAGAIILAINGQRVSNPQAVRQAAARVQPGAAVSLLLYDSELGEVVVNYRTRQ
jgi:serine protease Do